MADYALFRLAGTPASGAVTFARYTVGLATIIPVGCVVLTGDGTQSFLVVDDDSNPAWNGAGGYTLAAQQASVSVPAQCSASGSAGNVQAATIALLASPVTGIDSVTNVLAFAGGTGSESDQDFRSRFQLYINSRSLGTVGAVLNAVRAVQQGLRTIVVENVDSQLDALPGSFLIIADNGTGMPGALLLNAVQAAVDAVRPIGSRFAVQGPAVVTASATVILETSNPLTHAAIAASVQSAIIAWIGTLPIAGTLAISRIDAIAHSCDPSVVSVTSTLINGLPADLIAPETAVILVGSVVVI